jgi:hypothetical protein
VATILDDDATFLSINEPRVFELDSGTANATFTISRSGSLTGASSVRWGTTNGTADAGSDYVAVPPTTVNFAPGERVKTVSVVVNGDILDEPNENFTVVLSQPTGATIADTRGGRRSSTTTYRRSSPCTTSRSSRAAAGRQRRRSA